MLLKKNCCDLNLGEGLCIFTFFLFSSPRFWTLSIERFWFSFWSILNGVTLQKTSNLKMWKDEFSTVLSQGLKYGQQTAQSKKVYCLSKTISRTIPIFSLFSFRQNHHQSNTVILAPISRTSPFWKLTLGGWKIWDSKIANCSMEPNRNFAVAFNFLFVLAQDLLPVNLNRWRVSTPWPLFVENFNWVRENYYISEAKK